MDELQNKKEELDEFKKDFQVEVVMMTMLLLLKENNKNNKKILIIWQKKREQSERKMKEHIDNREMEKKHLK